jgi:hypothetical protein
MSQNAHGVRPIPDRNVALCSVDDLMLLLAGNGCALIDARPLSERGGRLVPNAISIPAVRRRCRSIGHGRRCSARWRFALHPWAFAFVSTGMILRSRAITRCVCFRIGHCASSAAQVEGG